MKVIKNKIIPFGSYLAINLFGLVFTKKELTERQKNHEAIHTAQMKDLWYIGFYILYVLEFIFRYLVQFTFNWKAAYYMLSFEQEAYLNERNLYYLNTRESHAWIKYLLE